MSSVLNTRTVITEANARYHNTDLHELAEDAGRKIASLLLKKYGKGKTYAFVCGTGFVGANCIIAARHLSGTGVVRVSIFLASRPGELSNPVTSAQWEKAKDQALIGDNILELKQDAYAGDIENHQILVEALLGGGINGKLKKRYRDIVTRMTHFRQRIASIDLPVPGYNWDYCISILYPKIEDSAVIDIDLPAEVELETGPGEIKALFSPRRDSYKSQNGKILVVGGSEKYHGAPLLACMAASKYAGLVYFYSSPSNRKLIRELESKLAEFIEVDDAGLENAVSQADAILFGPGWEINMPNTALLNHILTQFPEKKFVLDAGAMGMADLELVKISGSVLFTPSRGELRHLFRSSNFTSAAPEGLIKRFARENNCFVNLKGSTSILTGIDAFTGEIGLKMNRTGNRGMAKGGSGDMLAGITAAFATKNSMWLAMTAGAFVSGLAGDLALKKHGTFFSPTDSINHLQEAWKWAIDF